MIPRNREAAVYWLVRRVHLLAKAAGRTITTKNKWRRLDAFTLDQAIRRDLDDDVAAYFPFPNETLVGQMEPPENAKHVPENYADLLFDITTQLKSLKLPDGNALTVKDWRRLHGISYVAAQEADLVSEVRLRLGLRLNQNDKIEKIKYRKTRDSKTLRARNLKYPKERTALKAFIIDLVRNMKQENGNPIRFKGDWRRIHQGSLATAYAAGLAKEIYQELGIVSRQEYAAPWLKSES